jgi:beta-phosphoglucomutase-like phosphatase (HAD superfamily)
VPTSKPAPDGYLAAARSLGVPPAACVVVEDSSAGIAAGRAAGAHVVAVRAGNFHGQDQSLAHRIIDTLDELTPGFLDQLTRGPRP